MPEDHESDERDERPSSDESNESPSPDESDEPPAEDPAAEFKFLGEGRGPSDFAFYVLKFLLSSWRLILLPRSVRNWLGARRDWLVVRRDVEYHRLRSSDRFHVPDDEVVRVGGLWLVEYFAPSQIAALGDAIKRNNWDMRAFESNTRLLSASRRGGGMSWWSIANIVNSSTGTFLPLPSYHQQKLPEGISRVHLSGVAIGDSLTAVVAWITLTDEGSASVNEVWHADHRAELVRDEDGRPYSEWGEFTAYRKTQQSRRHLHDQARRWFANSCPGAFAEADTPQPVLDLMLLDKLSPTTHQDRWSPDVDRGLQALGLRGSRREWTTSTSLPGLLLDRADTTSAPALPPNTWGLWGQSSNVIAQLSGGADRLQGSGPNPHTAVGHIYDEECRATVVRVGLTALLQTIEDKSAEQRDTARARHGKFRMRDLAVLREDILSLSLDLAGIERDVRLYNKQAARHGMEPRFVVSSPPWDPDEEVWDFSKRLRKRQIAEVSKLRAADGDYREVLSTAAALGSSIDAFRVQRRAINIAGAALFVAVLTLVGPGTALESLREWWDAAWSWVF
ncbi:hypothetical protein ACWEK5_27940 [Rhodococcus koreensis]